MTSHSSLPFSIGVQLVLYISCALYLWKTRKTRSKSKFLLGYITLLFSIETIFEIVQARTVQIVHVDNRNYPGGPWAYFLATQNLPINIVFLASYFAVTFLSDLLVVSISPQTIGPCFDVLCLVMEMLGHLVWFWTAFCVSCYIVPCPYASGILR